MLFDDYLKELRLLNLPVNNYAIFGSGPLAVRGLREANDLDVIVRKKLWEMLKQKFPAIKENLIKIGNIEIYSNWQPWFASADELIDRAEIIEGVPFVQLNDVMTWKKLFTRKKDKEDLVLINKFLNK